MFLPCFHPVRLSMVATACAVSLLAAGCGGGGGSVPTAAADPVLPSPAPGPAIPAPAPGPAIPAAPVAAPAPPAAPAPADPAPAVPTPVTTPPAPVVDTAVPKRWVGIGAAAFPYKGSFLATQHVARRDGSNLYFFAGPSFDEPQGNCPTTGYRAFAVAADGSVTDASASLPAAAPVIYPRQLIVADFNGDGAEDLFFANTGCNVAPFGGEGNGLFLSAGSIFVARNDALPALRSYSTSAAAADLRKSGRIDVLVGVLGMQPNLLAPPGPNVQNGSSGPYILRGNGDGSFVYDNASLPDKVANPVQAGSAGLRFTSSRLADLNGDGYPDLILGSDDTGATAGSVFLNDGAGKFRTTEIVLPVGLFGPTNTATVAIIVADVNNDGRPDLLLSQTQRAPVFFGTGRVQVLLNRGGGGFIDATEQVLPGQKTNSSWSQWIHYVDLNGDGRPDILLENDKVDGDDVVVYASRGDGTFAALPRAQLPAALRSLHPLQFSGRTVLAAASKANGNAVLEVFERK